MKTIEQDLTVGNISSKLLRYALPMITVSLLQSVYSLVDTLVVGRYAGSSGISAVNNAGQLSMFVTNVAIGLTTGGGILVGQRFGQRDVEGQRRASGTMNTFSIFLGIATMVLLYIFAEPALVLLGAPALEEAVSYLRICSFGMVFVFGYNAISSVLRAIGNSKQPLYFILAAVTVNVFLDILFVRNFGMGVAGAALATVISQGISFFAALMYMVVYRERLESLRLFSKCYGNDLKQILKLGIPSALQMTIAGLSWLTVTSLVNGYGVIVSAGNGVSIKIKEFFQLFIAALANSAAVMVAQNIGAEQYDRAKQVMYTAMKYALVIAGASILVVEAFAWQLASVFTPDAAVASAAVLNMRIEIVGQVFYAIFLVYHSLMIGAGHSAFAMMSSFVNCILFRLVLALTLNHFFGLHGVYIACMIAPSSSVPLGYFYTRSNIWRRKLSP